MAKTTKTRRRTPQPGRLNVDQALIALFLGAMNANDHVAPSEAARAHHLIWSTRRFRRRSGEAVGKLIQDMRRLLDASDAGAVVGRAATTIPVSLRPGAFAVLVDLLLADGTLEAKERRFLREVSQALELNPKAARQIIEVILLKNGL